MITLNLILIVEEKDSVKFCDKCVVDFERAGGCECLSFDDCYHVDSLIPEGCFECGEAANDFCEAKRGND